MEPVDSYRTLPPTGRALVGMMERLGYTVPQAAQMLQLERSTGRGVADCSSQTMTSSTGARAQHREGNVMTDPVRGLLIACIECKWLFPPRGGESPEMYYCSPCPRCGLILAHDLAAEVNDVKEQVSLDCHDEKFHFTKAMDVAYAYTNRYPEDIQTAIRTAVRSFQRNMNRTTDVMVLLSYLVGRGMLENWVVNESRHTGHSEDAVRDGIETTYHVPTKLVHLGKTSIDTIISDENGGPDEAINAILASQIIGAWTAFEALTEDLWVQCLNARPRLGFIALDVEPSADDTEPETKSKRNAKIPIPHWMLRDPVFDFSKGMGILCREQKKWSFDRRDKAADAYYKIFKDDKPRLVSIFEDNELRLLAAVRNNLIHNAGVVDKEFETLAKNHTLLGNLKLGEAVPLTGDRVAKMINIADEQGGLLIDFVNGWLMANPQ
ncbi:MAG: hypothetical protein JWP89_4494 [Schlesneria sp.]|nr:hypothetical protein [Schlesneria sp.]